MGIFVLPALQTIRKKHRVCPTGKILSEGEIEEIQSWHHVYVDGKVLSIGEIARIWSERLETEGSIKTYGAIPEIIPSFVRAYGNAKSKGNIPEIIPSFVRVYGNIRANPNTHPYLQWERADIPITNGGTIEVATAQDLHNVRNNLTGHYIQTADIDLSSYDPWTPIDSFRGSYNGNGYKITGLKCEGTWPAGNNLGLFGYCQDAKFKNITIDNASITGESVLGILCGELYEDTPNTVEVENCHVSGIVNGTGSRQGGLMGALTLYTRTDGGASVQYCTAEADVEGTGTGGMVGALIGYWYAFVDNGSPGAIVRRCSSSGSAKSRERTGGLIGRLQGGILRECASTGNAEATVADKPAGGLAGITLTAAVIEDCYAHGEAVGDIPGGLVGDLDGTTIVRRCYSLYDLFGAEGANTTVEDCYFDKEIAKAEGNRGRTTIEMKTKATFDNWDFEDVWDNQSGFVILE